jgi:chromate transporter
MPTAIFYQAIAIMSSKTAQLDLANDVTLARVASYFLRLGATGFGGPIALAARMHRDLVEGGGWITEADYQEGLAFSQLLPGPLAAQLAMYIGWLRCGSMGAVLVAVTFVLPSFLMAMAVGIVYVHYGRLTWIQGAFYGIGASVIAIIAQGVYKLSRKALRKDWFLWALFAIVAAVTASTGTEIVWLILLAGLAAVLVKVMPRVRTGGVSGAVLPVLVTGLHGPAPGLLGTLFLFFLKAGAFVFGSGLAIVPFLYGQVVTTSHWLTEQQFLDAVAVAMITPGPVVITAAFIGYLVAGAAGGLVASAAVFAPPLLMVIAGAPYYRRFAQNGHVKAFVQGVTAAAVGAIAGAAFILGRRAIIDAPTVLIAVASFLTLRYATKVPEPLMILAAGVAGSLIRSGLP